MAYQRHRLKWLCGILASHASCRSHGRGSLKGLSWELGLLDLKQEALHQLDYIRGLSWTLGGFL